MMRALEAGCDCTRFQSLRIVWLRRFIRGRVDASRKVKGGRSISNFAFLGRRTVCGAGRTCAAPERSGGSRGTVPVSQAGDRGSFGVGACGLGQDPHGSLGPRRAPWLQDDFGSIHQTRNRAKNAGQEDAADPQEGRFWPAGRNVGMR